VQKTVAAPVSEATKATPIPRKSRKASEPALLASVVTPEPVKYEPPVINLPERPSQGPVKETTLVPVPTPTPPLHLRQSEMPIPLPLPDLLQLPYYEQVTPDPAMLEEKADVIQDTLKSFKVHATVREINPGPAVTQFALEPGNGVKVRRITELQNDLALALAAQSIRVEAPIPGMARVGIEIPNPKIATVGLREVLESPAFTKSKAKLPLPLGRDVNGRYIVGDLTRMPHLLIAGATGSGKSVCINAIISTLISVKQPDELRLLMIDPKMVELVGYNGVPHLQCPVVTEMDKVVSALRMVLREMNRRYELFKEIGVRNIDGYRAQTEDDPDAEKMPYLVVIIDELADLMMTTPDEVETLLARLTQMARATGIHLIIATQRPSVNVLTGLIKANVPARIAFAVSSMIDSRVVLDMPGAEKLLGRGDMLYLPPDEAKPTRVQGAFIDEEVKSIVDHWHAVAPIPQYVPEWIDLPSSKESSSTGGSGYEDEEEPYMQQALDIVRAQGNASASMLQRRLRIGYNRAARIIEQMEEDGIIGPADGAKGRPVLVGFDEPDLG
jgi:S-DNA-T family DNA segregation ATPase FtsK/SpoIIIE